MTRWLLSRLAGVRGSLWRQFLAACAVTILLPVTIGFDWLRWALAFARGKQILAQKTALCPRGHEVALWGDWQCESCGLVSYGNGLGPCRYCGEVAGALHCACGLPVTNPLSEMNS